MASDMQNEQTAFLLSLSLFNENLSSKAYIRKLYAIANSIEDNYYIFTIPKKNGNLRKIYAPNYTLKYIQRKIVENLLLSQYISRYAKAYHKGSSLNQNAIFHIKKPIILKLDIENFFDNITYKDVYEKVFYIFPENIRVLLTNLCVYKGGLPQGAPTSPYISNIIMRDFDEIIGKWCVKNNINYTRYSDDLTFSGNIIPKEVIKKVSQELSRCHLKLNKKKICIVKWHQQQRITGIVVNEKLQVPKKYRHKIRQEMYYIKKYGLKKHLHNISYSKSLETYIKSLSGKIAFVLMINNNDQEFKKYKEELNEIKKKNHW